MPYIRTIEVRKLKPEYRKRIRAVTKLRYISYIAGLGGKTLERAIEELEENNQKGQK